MAYVSTEVLSYTISKIKSSCDDNYAPLKNGLYIFSNTETYNTGMFVKYDDGKGAKLYICNTDATTGEWIDVKSNFAEVGLVINDADNASDSTTLSAKQINKLITDASLGADVDLSNYAKTVDVEANYAKKTDIVVETEDLDFSSLLA